MLLRTTVLHSMRGAQVALHLFGLLSLHLSISRPRLTVSSQLASLIRRYIRSVKAAALHPTFTTSRRATIPGQAARVGFMRSRAMTFARAGGRLKQRYSQLSLGRAPAAQPIR